MSERVNLFGAILILLLILIVVTMTWQAVNFIWGVAECAPASTQQV